MGKKYIITENQERLMFQLIEAELGPEESVLVAKKNPFKYEEFKDARRVYDASLKNGDRFYQHFHWDYNSSVFYKLGDEIKKALQDKTIRIGDDIRKIIVLASTEDIKILINGWSYYLEIERFINSQTEIKIVDEYSRRAEDPYIFKQKVIPIIQLVQSIIDKNKLVPTEEREDEFFAIREIQRKDTDF